MNAQQFSESEADVAMQVAGFDAAANIAEIATSLRRNGAAIVRELAPQGLMDKVREEVLNSVSEEDLKSSTHLWPEGNRTIGALVAVSRTFVEELLIHPGILQIADAMLLPLNPMAPTEGDNGKRHSRGDFIKVPDGTQVVWSSTNSQEGPNCHHYTVGASAMLEVGPGMKSHQVLHRENAVYQPYIEHLPMREFIMSAMWAGYRLYGGQRGYSIGTRQPQVAGRENCPEIRDHAGRDAERIRCTLVVAYPARSCKECKRGAPNGIFQLLHCRLASPGRKSVHRRAGAGCRDLA